MALPPETSLAERRGLAAPAFDPRSLLFWSALPLIVAQGLWLRRRAYRAPPAQGEPHGVEGEGPPLRLLALGDSIIAGVGIEKAADALPAAFARTLASRWRRRVEWTACGRNGADVAATRRMLQRLPPSPAPPDLILLSIGVNDTTGLISRRRFVQELDALYRALRERSPGALLLHAGLPPLQAFPLLPSPLRQLLGLRASQLDALIPDALQRVAPAVHLPFNQLPSPTQFAADGFHPDAEACASWADSLVTRIDPPAHGG